MDRLERTASDEAPKLLAAARRPSGSLRSFDRAQEYCEVWMPGREALARLCRERPSHSDVAATISKLWLIGRSHAAALERRPRGNRDEDEDIYRLVAKDMARKSVVLDNGLRKLRRRRDLYAAEGLLEIHGLVNILAQLFERSTGVFKISLASKYLHYHDTRIPILDTLAEGALRDLVPKRTASIVVKTRYGAHLARFARAHDILKRKRFKVDARRLDNFLMWWSVE
jgi:hypothetical protein